MKKIKIKGGLGNQLFQYAYGRNCIEQGEFVNFDISFFEEKNKDINRPFLLKKFNILEPIDFVKQKESSFKKIFNKIFSKISGNYGFFQSENYFKNIKEKIRKEFTLKDPLSTTAREFADQIMSQNCSISIHIRRGDYISNKKTNKHHGTCALEYYQKAISYIKKEIEFPTFFIFSDDINWAKENLKIENSTYVSSPNLTECEELIIMSYCKHNIITNSSFSWWGAWLNQNPNKIVIAPKQWTTKHTSDELKILPKEWIQM